MKNAFSRAAFWCAAGAFFSFQKAEKAPAEPPIQWQNPSFEGQPERSKCPAGWAEGSAGSTPDIQPGAWGVQSPAAHEGLTYLGLIARDDGEREDIGQSLAEKLEAGKCYRFTVWAAHSPSYAKHDFPLRLRVWGGAASGSKAQILASSGPVSSEKWTKITVQFTAKSDIRFIVFEADYAPGTLQFYKGNVLIDDLSPIEKCDRA